MSTVSSRSRSAISRISASIATKFGMVSSCLKSAMIAADLPSGETSELM